MNPLLCRGFMVLGGLAGVYSRVIGMVALRRANACRWVGVAVVIFSIWWLPIMMVCRVRVARWSSRSRKLRAGSPLVVILRAALASAQRERWAGATGLPRGAGCSSV